MTQGDSVSTDRLKTRPRAGASAGTNDDEYRKYLLAEYNNIAQAHFDTGKTITQFFQFYLLILTLPVSLAGALLKVTTGGTFDFAAAIHSAAAPYFALVLLAIALVGFSMMAYTINLRLDVLLYARTVNGIRRYFTLQAKIPPVVEAGVRVLPRSVHQPSYSEFGFFGWVVLAFSILDSVYFFGAAALLAHRWWGIPEAVPASWAVAFLLTHFLAYVGLVSYRDRRYLHGYSIGIDIVGVLGDHRQQFAKILKEVKGKVIDPQAITRIPVHECAGLDVCEPDEHAVFNEPSYWTGMPVYPQAAKRIEELRKIAGYRIHIFSYRPWPNPKTLSPSAWEQWIPTRALRWVLRLTRLGKWYVARPWRINRITRDWLRENGIRANRLTIERGNVHMSESRVRTKNRFTISKAKGIRIFVEDDGSKALKLAGICDYVLLFDQPYNRHLTRQLPANVVLVHSWDEVYRFFRDNL